MSQEFQITVCRPVSTMYQYLQVCIPNLPFFSYTEINVFGRVLTWGPKSIHRTVFVSICIHWTLETLAYLQVKNFLDQLWKPRVPTEGTGSASRWVTNSFKALPWVIPKRNSNLPIVATFLNVSFYYCPHVAVPI